MKVKGFTLFELLAASALSILMASLALPGCKHLKLSNAIDNDAFNLMSNIQTARKLAISDSKNIVLCGSSTKSECDSDWSSGYLLFADRNNNNSYEAEEDELINYHQITVPEFNIRWRSFRGNKPIRFLPMGITWHNNGTFVMCINQQPKYAKAIFLAKSGRAEMSRDDNHDGIDEGRDDKPIGCA